jgi:transketolase
MGDLIGQSTGGKLYFIPHDEFLNLKNSNLSAIQKTALFAYMCRINSLYMIARAGSGHIGSSFSSMEIMSWLELNELSNLNSPEDGMPRNLFFSSKGHDAPGLYSIWLAQNKLNFDLIHQLRRLNGLPGHPDILTPNVITNTGSLGMGISKAKGMIRANRIKGIISNVFVLTGDGELQEGQIWESLFSAANDNLNELIVIIDHNKLQSDTLVSKVSDLGDLVSKFKSFGWDVHRCNGNDVEDFSSALGRAKEVVNRPKVIIADTIKGKGVSFMEHTSIDSDVDYYKFHSGAPNEELYTRALNELVLYVNNFRKKNELNAVQLSEVKRPSTIKIENQERLVQAYSEALLEHARVNKNIVVLDADLILDTGLIPFKEEFPDRFIECGIAEQDMVSQAGGIALMGMLPVVHSFSCFLSSRPNEQIYNNATERSKIIYVGSLAGIVPAGPGHSHQAVRDISSLSGIPGLIMIEPSNEMEIKLLFNWAVNVNLASTYIRLVSVPVIPGYTLPVDYIPKLGEGVSLNGGKDGVIIAAGPIMLSLALKAANYLNENYNKSVRVVNMPWLNVVNSEWLINELSEIPVWLSLDNHYRIGGQGDRIADVILSSYLRPIFYRMAVEEIPVSGSLEEVLEHHKFTLDQIVQIFNFSK